MLYYYRPVKPDPQAKTIDTDICIYGATSAGVVAAVQAAQLGKKVVLVEFGRRIGGLTASGLGATDIGNKHVIGGLARIFYQDVGKEYNMNESWFFEPHIALKVYSDWLSKYNVPLYPDSPLAHVSKKEGRIQSIQTERGDIFKAKVYIDATYEGDLMASAGVSYTVGRESDEEYEEHYNGIHFGSHHHNFLRYVSPYRNPDDPKSGLIPGINDLPAGKQGEGDNLIQAYNFRLCLSDNPKNKVPYPKPDNYDPDQFEIMRRYIDARIFDLFGLTRPLPNQKADHNNWGAVNTDYIGGNYEWPNADYAIREQIYQNHVTYQQGLFYFCANDERLPKKIHEVTNNWGLAGDEFEGTGHWPPLLYIREARRMISDYVLTENNAMGRFYPQDSIGMASYKMDSHNCKRIVRSGRVVNEGNVEVAPLNPIPIPYRTIRPKRSECTNLLVSTCISASHIGYGAVRMEPVFMIIGQSAAVAASMAVDGTGIVQDITFSTLESKLKEHGQILHEQEDKKPGIVIQ